MSPPEITGTALAAVRFFQANPDEVLLRQDVAAKFGIVPGAVESELRPAVDAALITIAKGGDSSRVWRAGPALAGWGEHGAVATKPATSPSKRRARVVLPPLDASKLRVRDDAPLPFRSGVRGVSSYDATLDLLKADGMSVAGIPAAYLGVLTKACTVYLAARPALAATSVLRVRRVSDTEIGVWRLAKDSDEATSRGRPAPKASSAAAATPLHAARSTRRAA